jgi:hypothetical protein
MWDLAALSDMMQTQRLEFLLPAAAANPSASSPRLGGGGLREPEASPAVPGQRYLLSLLPPQ